MKTIKKVCGILAIAVTVVSSFPLAVFAADTNNNDTIEIVNEKSESILLEDLQTQYGIATSEDFVSADLLKDKFFSKSFSKDLLRDGDQYEPNNMISTATTGLMGHKISATLHDGDVDWYKFDAIDVSEPYSFVLMNIPSNCNYDMALFNSDFTGAYYNFQDGNASEAFYITLNSTGTYYVAVQSSSGFSSSPYTLYFGPAFKTGNTGWRSTGLTFNFGYIPQGNTYYTSVSPQHYNLTNDNSIPNGSVMTQLYIDNNGNGGNWGGFYKYIREPSGYGMEQYGNLQAFDVPDMTYYVKQDWEIWGKLLYSYSFIWQPNILIGYKFVVTPQTMGYVN